MTSDTNDSLLVNSSSAVPYFLPQVLSPVGAAHVPQPDSAPVPVPLLFTPLTVKGVTFNNRIGVSPMCTYSAAHDGEHVGEVTPFHLVHYGSFALRGAGLIIIEATAVEPEGRLSPEDLGLYTDEQALKLKEIVDFAHSQGSKIGIQIGHGGRKASGTPPYNHLQKGVGKKYHGWSDVPNAVVGPSAISFGEQFYVVPHELTLQEVESLVQKFKEAVKRAYDISGFDFIELHGAHGYLISSFLSATSNKRTDKYGGSFENRIRFLLEIIDEVADDKHPLFVRISGSELLEGINAEGWTVEDSIKLADELIKHNVDVLDVSSGGNNSDQARRKNAQGFQVPLADAVKKHVGNKLTVASVGKLYDAKLANKVLEDGSADIILNGSQFLKDPGLTIRMADELGVRINFARQYGWPFYPPKF